ncbi:DNA internalization-related competence protein ComEC/Rec2 [Bacillaceae bacterium IKA-2]|nr:DNA internalization-related competence protein ComEC/Rec2 [Bacillaceae bacterium IKA-2]
MFGKFYVIVVAALSSIILRIGGLHSVSFFFVVALIYLLYKHKSNYLLLSICLLTFVFLYFNPYYFKPPPMVPTSNTITGTIHSLPKQAGNKTSFEFKTIENNKVLVNSFAKTEQEKEELEKLIYGMRCSLQGQFSVPPEPRNFYAFDYKNYLASRNIHFLYTLSSFQVTNCHKTTLSAYQLLQTYRQAGIKHLSENIPKESKGVIIALVFGDRGEMQHEILEAYQRLGIIHLLAVSGLHVGLISATLYFLLIRIGVTKERSLDLLLIILPIYAILAGAAPSVLRATAMCIAVLLSLKASLKLNPLDGISCVCLLLLFINPAYVLHLGFQLSFLVSFSLIISAKTILRRYTSFPIQLLAVTTLAQCISFPIIVYHFYEISLWSIPLNLLYIPFITFFVLPFSFVIMISSLFSGPLIEPVLLLYNFAISVAHNGLSFVLDFNYSTLKFGKPPLFIIVFYYLTIAVNLYVWEKSDSLNQFLKSSTPFFFVVLLHWHLPYLINEGEITMIDVGQGDSIYIELPRRKAIYLIDTGGVVDFGIKQEWSQRSKSFDVGEDVLLAFLKAKGVRKVDKLILTHGHYDHIAGAKALLGVVPVQTILYGVGAVEGSFERELLQSYYHQGTKIKFVQNGDFWKLGNYKFAILSPLGNEESLNNRSIVIYTKIGGLYWLFTGDLEQEGERQLLANYHNLNVDVLKVGHHGSNTSTTDVLLDVIKPQYALIPVGKSNFYGHPHSEVLSRLNDRQITILRTDQHGSIRYRFDHTGGEFQWLIQ